MKNRPAHRTCPPSPRILSALALLAGTAVAGFVVATAPSVVQADIYRCLTPNQEESFSNVRCEEFGYITLERIEGVNEVKGKVAPPKSRRGGGDCYGTGVKYGREEIRWEEVPDPDRQTS